MKRLSLLLVVAVLLSAASIARELSDPEDPAPLALTHANVVDVERGRVLPDRTVLIRGNRIVAVAPAARFRVPHGARVIDARGKYLIPGLVDTHIHLGWDPEVGDSHQDLRLLLAYGVTTVREVGTRLRTSAGPQPQEKHNLAARDAVSAGDLVAPRLWIAGRVDDRAIQLAGAEDARGLTRHLIEMGVDGIKIRDGLSVDAIQAVVEEAHRHGKPVFGHTTNWSLAEWDYTLAALRAGVDGVMHMNFPPVGASELPPEPEGERFSGSNLMEWYLWYTGLWLHIDPEAERTLIREMTRRGTWIEPTLIWDSLFVEGERYRESLPARLDPENFEMYLYSFPQREGEAAVLHHAAVAKMGEFLRRFHDAGGTLIAGTDAVFLAGWGLHEELRLFVHVGLSPVTALQAATIDAALALGWEDRIGTVEAGKLADLVLLDGDPLEDIGNTRRICAVVADGRVLDRAALDELAGTDPASSRAARAECEPD